MGTQQILMIVLSVIVVGAAVAVGIQMFDTQATNQTRNAMTNDIANMAVQAQGWFRTPTMMGGGGQTGPATTDLVAILRYIDSRSDSDTQLETNNGTYVIAVVANQGITIIGSSNTTPVINVSAAVNLRMGQEGISIAPNTATPPTMPAP